MSDTPPGYSPGQRDVPGGFTGDKDVMDTWATSSLTPQIAGGWPSDADLFGRVYPMDLRPQAHEIIRTWLFYTVLRSEVLEDTLPWRNAAISGWILDPDRKKMSKSAGNVVTPADLLREYGTDAVRYWAASARLGVDTAFDQAQLKIGRRLAIKILNATRFVLGFGERIRRRLDRVHRSGRGRFSMAFRRGLVLGDDSADGGEDLLHRRFLGGRFGHGVEAVSLSGHEGGAQPRAAGPLPQTPAGKGAS